MFGVLIRLPFRMVPKSIVIPILTGNLKGTRWIVGASNHSCWLGIYEPEQRKLFSRLVKPSQICYDFGAHAGFYTLLASRLVGEKGRVLAFEPNTLNLAYLRRHLELNRISNVPLAINPVRHSFIRGALWEATFPRPGILKFKQLGSTISFQEATQFQTLLRWISKGLSTPRSKAGKIRLKSFLP